MKKFSNWMLILSAFMLILALSGCVVAVEKFTITYETVRGTKPEDTKIIEGIKLRKTELPDLGVVDGYHFLGWYVKGEENKKVLEPDQYSVKKSITLVALWDEGAGSKEDAQKTTWTVTYNNGGHGAEKTADEVTKGETLPATSIAALEATGWRFDGWYVGETRVDATYKPTANVTLTAKWTQLFTVNIYKDADNTVPACVLTIPNGDAISLKKDTDYKDAKTDYLFDGYWTKKTAEAEAVQYIDKDGKVVEGKTVTANLDLYPVFYAELKSITVTGSKLFKVGDAFDNTAYTVTAKYGEGIADKTLAAADWTQEGFTTTAPTINGTFTVSYVDHGITKTAEASYYVRAADALTTNLTPFVPTTAKVGETYYKLGDFPNRKETDVDVLASMTSQPVYNNWYLADNGRFYEKFNDEYYEVVPIEWRVCTENYNGSGNALMISTNILLAGVAYYSVAPTAGDIGLRTIGGQEIVPNSYKYSLIRAYLNGNFEEGDIQSENTELNKYLGLNSFFQTAFDPNVQQLISSTTLTDAGTSDKVFLISEAEFDENGSNGYGFDWIGHRVMIASDADYAKAHGLNVSVDGTASWMLRTGAGITNDGQKKQIKYVDGGGDIVLGLASDTADVGVVPAITIALTAGN